MDLAITTTNVSVASDSREIIEARIESALDRFADDILSVSATFSDQNGPKGGRDTRCVLTLRGRRFRHLVAVAEGNSVEHAATIAARKMADRLRKIRSQLADHRGRTPKPLVPEYEPSMDWATREYDGLEAG